MTIFFYFLSIFYLDFCLINSQSAPALQGYINDRPRDCADILANGEDTSGPYIIYLRGTTPVLVYCDMETDLGGWTVFQRRKDGSQNFYRGWSDYANGFGDVSGEFWLGNDALPNGLQCVNAPSYSLAVTRAQGNQRVNVPEVDSLKLVSDNACVKPENNDMSVKPAGITTTDDNGNEIISALTAIRVYNLRIDLADFTGQKRYAKYADFRVGPGCDKYPLLSISAYTGTSGDSLSGHKGYRFSTLDNDNDVSTTSCAQLYKGAWWYNACHASNLNGLYLKGAHTSYADGVEWYAWTGHFYSLQFTEMKIRPRDFD